MGENELACPQCGTNKTDIYFTRGYFDRGFINVFDTDDNALIPELSVKANNMLSFLYNRTDEYYCTSAQFIRSVFKGDEALFNIIVKELVDKGYLLWLTEGQEYYVNPGKLKKRM